MGGGGGAWTWPQVRLEAEFGVRSPDKRKNLRSSGTTRGKKKLGHNPGERESYIICLNVTLNVTREHTAHENSEIYCTDFLVISEIGKTKFEVIVTYIFGGKIWGSDTNLRALKCKFWLDQLFELFTRNKIFNFKNTIWNPQLHQIYPSRQRCPINDQ